MEILTKNWYKLHAAFHKRVLSTKGMMQLLFRDTWGSHSKGSAAYFTQKSWALFTQYFTIAHTVPMFEVCQRIELAE